MITHLNAHAHNAHAERPCAGDISFGFYGDRGASVKDPAGVSWYIATHVEDVATAELKKRADAHMRQQAGQAA